MEPLVIGPRLQYDVEQFLYHEAELLDEGRFQEWLDLLTDDVRYWMPVRETLQGRPDGLHPEDAPAVSLMDDDKEFLEKRVARLETGLAHSEMPPSRTRHLITNVRILSAGEDVLAIVSNFHVFQGRAGRADHEFFGRREDRLLHLDGAFKIAWRKIVLDHTVLPRALSILF
jgi:3-phenylpropionate/cinnamic acid dioxygenase small subunit